MWGESQCSRFYPQLHCPGCGAGKTACRAACSHTRRELPVPLAVREGGREGAGNKIPGLVYTLHSSSLSWKYCWDTLAFILFVRRFFTSGCWVLGSSGSSHTQHRHTHAHTQPHNLQYLGGWKFSRPSLQRPLDDVTGGPTSAVILETFGRLGTCWPGLYGGESLYLREEQENARKSK